MGKETFTLTPDHRWGGGDGVGSGYGSRLRKISSGSRQGPDTGDGGLRSGTTGLVTGRGEGAGCS